MSDYARVSVGCTGDLYIGCLPHFTSSEECKGDQEASPAFLYQVILLWDLEKGFPTRNYIGSKMK